MNETCYMYQDAFYFIMDTPTPQPAQLGCASPRTVCQIANCDLVTWLCMLLVVHQVFMCDLVAWLCLLLIVRF